MKRLSCRPRIRPNPAEMGQVERQRGRRKAQRFANGAGLEAFRPGLHQGAKDGEARLVTEGGKGFGSR
jgi:hypothetical protein